MNNTLLTRLNDLPDGRKVLGAVLACVVTTLVASPLRGILDLANIVMLFLLTVLLVAVAMGRAAAVVSAFLSVLLFDVFFVPPRLSLAVEDAQYLVTFAVMLATALITAHLTAGLRREAEAAAATERQTRALYGMAGELAGALTGEQVADIVARFLRGAANMEGTILLPDGGGLVPLRKDAAVSGIPPLMARLAFDSGQIVDSNQVDAGSGASACVPVKSPMCVRGVLAVRPLDGDVDTVRKQCHLLEAAASLAGIAIERLHYVDIAQQSQLETVAERLRSSILSALSHDLRTPLTALVGLADSLTLIKPALPEAALETAQALRSQAARLSGLVGNLLDMARLQAGRVTLRKEWQPLEEVIGSAIKLLGAALDVHPVHVGLAPDLPWLEFDAVLMERVFCNLLDNAAKYAPAGTPIDILARRDGALADIRVCDRGPGFPAGKLEMFDMFVRGEASGSEPGVGLGLAICRAIVEAHGGSIAAVDREGGGACVRISLPVGMPPRLDDDADDAMGSGQ